ncbi:branched-chain amino acid ABC transporter permease [Candidatus Woesearchaeota archaeon]|nr:branched-chain amino acid ABC transporter permease [Candidatus Woesearchaeota archaeon]
MQFILPQLIINGLIAGSIYALAASGLSLAYYVMKFLNFAQGAIITLSAYLFYVFLDIAKLDYRLSAIFVIISSTVIMLFIDFVVQRPLRKRKSTNIVSMMASLSILIFVSSFVLAVFSSDTKILKITRSNATFDFGFFTITKIQAFIIGTTLLLFFALYFLIKKTKIGKTMRAISDNRDSARIVGINPERVYIYTTITAAFLGSIAGMLIALEQNAYPQMGVPIIIKGFISSVVGGINSVPGAILGGLLIGLAENVGAWFLPSTYKDVISFVILLFFLFFRPNGILGARMRDDS